MTEVLPLNFASARGSLPELVRNRLAELDLSPRRAAERSKGGVSYETLRQIQIGRRNTVPDRIAEGLSVALQVPVTWIYESMQVQPPPARWELPEEAHRLPVAYRGEIEGHIRTLLRALEDTPDA